MRFPKQQFIRSEPYRRLVASMPCIHCGRVGASQAAHENAGKGMRMKACDTKTFPMCHAGANDCHVRFDTYKLVPGGREAHAALGRKYAEETRRALLRLAAAGDRAVKEVLDRVGIAA